MISSSLYLNNDQRLIARFSFCCILLTNWREKLSNRVLQYVKINSHRTIPIAGMTILGDYLKFTASCYFYPMAILFSLKSTLKAEISYASSYRFLYTPIKIQDYSPIPVYFL
jgi:hypothetical protein